MNNDPSHVARRKKIAASMKPKCGQMVRVKDPYATVSVPFLLLGVWNDRIYLGHNLQPPRDAEEAKKWFGQLVISPDANLDIMGTISPEADEPFIVGPSICTEK